MREIQVRTNKRTEMVDITCNIEKVVSDEKIIEGLIVVFVPHTTAAVTINEGADPDVKTDITNFLLNLILKDKAFKHSEGNSDAHIKASIIGSSETIIVKNGRLILGTWQHIFFFEGDGPRNRKVFIEIIKKE